MKRLQQATVMTALAALLLAGTAGADLLYVDVNYDGSQGASDGSSNRPYVSVRSAVGYANGDLANKTWNIYIADGTYNDAVENFTANGKLVLGTNIAQAHAMNLYGGYVGQVSGASFDWSTRLSRSSVIDAEGKSRVFETELGLGGSGTYNIDGLTVKGGGGTGGEGFFCENNCSSTISDCLFTGNAGAGAYLHSWSSAKHLVTNSVFRQNTNYGIIGRGTISYPIEIRNTLIETNSGVGLRVNAMALILADSVIRGNTKQGLLFSSTASGCGPAAIDRSVITGNSYEGILLNSYEAGWTANGGFSMTNSLVANNGGVGVHFHWWVRNDTGLPKAMLSHNTIVNNGGNGVTFVKRHNTANNPAPELVARNNIIAFNSGYAVDFYYDSHDRYQNPTENYNVIYGNTAGAFRNNTYNTVTNSAGAGGFPGPETKVTNPQFADAANGDYRLQSSSPAVDSGADLGIMIDLPGKLRPLGSGFDIGCYELDPPPTGTLILIR